MSAYFVHQFQFCWFVTLLYSIEVTGRWLWMCCNFGSGFRWLPRLHVSKWWLLDNFGSDLSDIDFRRMGWFIFTCLRQWRVIRGAIVNIVSGCWTSTIHTEQQHIRKIDCKKTMGIVKCRNTRFFFSVTDTKPVNGFFVILLVNPCAVHSRCISELHFWHWNNWLEGLLQSSWKSHKRSSIPVTNS